VERNHGHVFVSHALSYLTVSKNGLSDVEMEDVLSLDDVVLNDVFQHWLPPIRRVPPLLLPRLQDELSSYIIQREANGTVVFYWYHRQFIFVARSRYLAEVGHRLYIHTSLAHYFLGTWGGGKCKPFRYSAMQMALMSIDGKENDVADRKVPLQPLILGKDPVVIYNLRKLSELPYHLLESRQYLLLKQEVVHLPRVPSVLPIVIKFTKPLYVCKIQVVFSLFRTTFISCFFVHGGHLPENLEKSVKLTLVREKSGKSGVVYL